MLSHRTRRRTFRSALFGSKLLVGISIHMGIVSLEVAAARGAAFAWLDMEHAPFGVGELHHACRAADAHDLPLLVRVSKNQPAEVSQALDAGAVGVMVPHVSTPDDASRAVSYAKFGSEGVRSACPQVRAVGWSGRDAWDDNWPRLNAESVVCVLVEDEEGYRNLESIIAVDGVDMVLLGTGDLAQSMGLGAGRGAVEMQAARERCLELCLAHGKVSFFNLPVRDGIDSFRNAREAGHRVFSWPDVSVYAEGLTLLLSAADG